ncbi:MAG: hypothetical protein BWK79_04525 [Beggiatoa sp. IS2]|nr:MAG: hypothetical protein BWK79_04525 [Beggiatoa sp. IS2]
MKILIVDDEPLARDRLRALVNELGSGQDITEANNGREAVRLAQIYHPEIVFLDIRMPVMDGMEAARRLTEVHPTPAIIFTTAYGDHALEAYEQQAVDYLLKPIRKERLAQALQRAYTLQHGIVSLPTTGAVRSHLSITLAGKLHIVPVSQIYYFRSDQKYVTVYWQKGETLVSEPLRDLEQEFAGQFLRIHRRLLVALAYVTSLDKDHHGHSYLHLKGVTEPLEVSKRLLPTVRKVLKDMHVAGA